MGSRIRSALRQSCAQLGRDSSVSRAGLPCRPRVRPSVLADRRDAQPDRSHCQDGVDFVAGHGSGVACRQLVDASRGTEAFRSISTQSRAKPVTGCTEERDPQEKIAAPGVPYWVLIISTGNFNAGTPCHYSMVRYRARPGWRGFSMRMWSEILRAEVALFRTIFNHYRPELHYMRGPGPKWLEKHGSRSDRGQGDTPDGAVDAEVRSL